MHRLVDVFDRIGVEPARIVPLHLDGDRRTCAGRGSKLRPAAYRCPAAAAARCRPDWEDAPLIAQQTRWRLSVLAECTGW